MVFEKDHNTPPPLKTPHHRKKRHKEGDMIKGTIKQANDHWNNQKFQIHWNELKWVLD